MDERNRKWIVAVDGGGSKITVGGVAAESAQSIWPSVPTDCLHRFSVERTGAVGELNWPEAQGNIAFSVQRFCELANSDISQIDTLLLALSGAGRPSDRNRVRSVMQHSLALAGDARIVVVGDIDPLVHFQRTPTTNEGTIAVIVGTGSIVAASRDGSLVRAGGWGPILGDECSGWAIAREALCQLCQSLDRNDDPDSYPLMAQIAYDFILSQKTTNAPFEPARWEISTHIIRLAGDRHAAAKMAPLILDRVYRFGDPATMQFFAGQIDKLVGQIGSVFARCDFADRQWKLALCGGLVANHQEFQSHLLARCRDRDLNFSEFFVVDPLVATLQMAVKQFRNGTNC